jgi:hypothetical protein
VSLSIIRKLKVLDEFIKNGYPEDARLQELRRLAVDQLTSLYNSNNRALESLMNPKLIDPGKKE